MTRLLITTIALVAAANTASAQSLTTEVRNATRSEFTATAPVTAEEHMQVARRAASSGAYDVARREYRIAAVLQRESGQLATEATYGLIQVLYAQAANDEAVFELDHLALDAAKQADFETEARVRADAIWLKAEAGDMKGARKDARRLNAIVRTGALSAGTQEYVTARVR
ncbi:hypothetical protein [Gemmatimonas sp.]